MDGIINQSINPNRDKPPNPPPDHHRIAHTRWATHGGKTDLNAHPHTDSKGRVAIVHNGTITNSHELRGELQKQVRVYVHIGGLVAFGGRYASMPQRSSNHLPHTPKHWTNRASSSSPRRTRR